MACLGAGAALEAAKLEGARQIAADWEADLAPGSGKIWRRMLALDPRAGRGDLPAHRRGETVLVLSADSGMPRVG
jgi:hypothetical protein